MPAAVHASTSNNCAGAVSVVVSALQVVKKAVPYLRIRRVAHQDRVIDTPPLAAQPPADYLQFKAVVLSVHAAGEQQHAVRQHALVKGALVAFEILGFKLVGLFDFRVLPRLAKACVYKNLERLLTVLFACLNSSISPSHGMEIGEGKALRWKLRTLAPGFVATHFPGWLFHLCSLKVCSQFLHL